MTAVGFDFDHTLGVDNGLERKAFFLLAAEAGSPLAEDDRDARASVDAALARFRDWKMTLDEAIDGFAHGMGKPWNLKAPADARFREICYDLVDTMVQPVDGARALLDALDAERIPYAILTNGWAPLQQKKIARALGALDVPLLVSATIGVQKPDARAFGLLCEALGQTPADVWYVGDNPRGDVAGAIAAGLRGIWFDAEGATYPPEIAQPSARVHRLAEVLEVVRGSVAPTPKM